MKKRGVVYVLVSLGCLKDSFLCFLSCNRLILVFFCVRSQVCIFVLLKNAVFVIIIGV